MQQDIILAAFVVSVRTGLFGLRTKFRVQTVTSVLAAIDKTFKLAGKPNTLHRAHNVYDLAIKMVKGYGQEDPPSVPQLAIFISVPKAYFKSGWASQDDCLQHIGCFILVKFYYLLHNGRIHHVKVCIYSWNLTTRNKNKTVLGVQCWLLLK